MTGAVDGVADDDSLVDLRCSVVVAHRSQVLLIRRGDDLGRGRPADWVLPGGRPYPHEGMAACARREVLEETGLRVSPTRCAFVGEVIDPDGGRTVEITFVVVLSGAEPPHLVGEPGMHPTWVALGDARSVRLRPPIAGFLPSVMHPQAVTAAYLGNLWRGAEADRGGQP